MMAKTKIKNINSDFAPLVTELRGLIQSARHAVASTVNTLQVMTNFEIGRRIVEYEQKGAERAEYGELLMYTLSAQLTEEFGRGFSKRNLEYMRRFYLDYADRLFPIVQKASAQLDDVDILKKTCVNPTVFEKFSSKVPFNISWSHYVLLLTIKNPAERSFYEIEATKEGWSLPELKRQVSSCLFERLSLSRESKAFGNLQVKAKSSSSPKTFSKSLTYSNSWVLMKSRAIPNVTWKAL